MARVTHFDITGDNPEGLIPFYKKVFGWKFEKWNGPMEYWMVTTGPEDKPGINGGLGKREKDNNTVNTIEVEDIDEAISKVTSNGGTLIQEKGAIPGVGWFAMFKDPENNQFGLMQSDTSAS